MAGFDLNLLYLKQEGKHLQFKIKLRVINNKIITELTMAAVVMALCLLASDGSLVRM